MSFPLGPVQLGEPRILSRGLVVTGVGQWPESLPSVPVSIYSSRCLPTSMQVPRRQEKADNVWTEESWNQFLQELETGQKVSVGLVLWEWMHPRQRILASEFIPSDSPFPSLAQETSGG